jgi:hypothetical protein
MIQQLRIVIDTAAYSNGLDAVEYSIYILPPGWCR